ncbi:MAG: hypothetical protein HQL99_01015 [Magnetococcales bacterium]|nr:hypothetical protein [Magnetococcales bacterium]
MSVSCVAGARVGLSSSLMEVFGSRGGRRGVVWMLVSALLWIAFPVWAAGEVFQDDFNRAEGKGVGNDWNVTPNHNDCPQPKGARKPSRNPDKDGDAHAPDAKNPLYDEITREIEKKTGKKPVGKGQENAKLPAEPFQGVTARLRDGMLFFQYAQHQDAQMVQREFPRPLLRLTYDFTPLYAMGGLDDRAWIGVRVFYLDRDDMILGEVRHFFYQSDFPERDDSDTVHVISQKGSFDGTARQANIDLQKILEQRLRGVDRKRIAKTRLSFEAATGLCSSSVEAYVDNVVATFGDGPQPVRITREILLEIAETGVESFARARSGFPGHWKTALFDKYGQSVLTSWLNELPADTRNDAVRLNEHLAQRYALTGKDLWLVGHAVTVLLQSK